MNGRMFNKMNRFFILFSAVVLMMIGTSSVYAQGKFRTSEYKPVTLNQLRLAPENYRNAKVAFKADVSAFALAAPVETITKQGTHITFTMAKAMENDKNLPIFVKKTNEFLNTFADTEFPVEIILYGSVKRVGPRIKEKVAFTYYVEALHVEIVPPEEIEPPHGSAGDIEEDKEEKTDSTEEDKNESEKDSKESENATLSDDGSDKPLPPKSEPPPPDDWEPRENPDEKHALSPEKPIPAEPEVKQQPVTTEPKVKQQEPEVKQQPVTEPEKKDEPPHKKSSVLKWE